MASPASLNLLGEISLLSSLVSCSWCLFFGGGGFLLSFLVVLVLFICILIVSMDLFILDFILVLWDMFVSWYI